MLLDTHFLLWSVAASRKLPPEVRALLTDPRNMVLYSAASIWEVAIKSTLGRADFRVDVPQLLQAAVKTGFVELPITSAHAARVTTLPELHKDPFDRMLLAQASTEGMLLVTADAQLAAYPGPVRKI